MIRPRRRHLAVSGRRVARILNQELPLIRRVLQGIQIESYQVIEKVSFDLASEDVDFRTQDIERMAISS